MEQVPCPDRPDVDDHTIWLHNHDIDGYGRCGECGESTGRYLADHSVTVRLDVR